MSNIEEEKQKLKGLKLGGYGFTTKDLSKDVTKVIKNIKDIQLEGTDIYGKYQNILIRGDGKIFVIVGCDEYYLTAIFEDKSI